jgi:ribosome maturation factor RimP
MNSINEKILTIAQEVTAQKNLLLIDILLRGNERNRVIEIFIDGEDIVSAETCALVSREINHIIYTDNIIESSYRLDVSTPGVEKPLKYLAQFKKHIQRKFEVEYKTDDKTGKFQGKLIDIQDDVLVFDCGREVQIKFNRIIKATVLVSFS